MAKFIVYWDATISALIEAETLEFAQEKAKYMLDHEPFEFSSKNTDITIESEE